MKPFKFSKKCILKETAQVGWWYLQGGCAVHIWDAPWGGSTEAGLALDMSTVHCQGICPPTMLTTMMIFIILWDKQEGWLWTCPDICSPTCFQFWPTVFLERNPRINLFLDPCAVWIFWGWHSSTRFPHSRSNLLRYTRTTQRKFHQCEEFSLKVGTGKRDGGDGENKYFSVLIRGNSVRSRSLQSLC